MKKVLIIESSLRQGVTKRTSAKITDLLKANGIEVELVTLQNETVHPCCGCCACLTQGSRRCPYYGDGAQKILGKMIDADGVIYVTPNYSLSVPGILKVLLDRLAYVFHRPRLFNKSCLAVIVQGVYGGKKVAKFINEVMEFWGMKIVEGVVIAGAVYPNIPGNRKIEEKDHINLSKAIDRYTASLNNEKPKKPSLFRVAIFHATRSSMKYFSEALKPDKDYYRTNGWLDSDYYYPVYLNPVKKIVGAFIDSMIRNMGEKSSQESMSH